MKNESIYRRSEVVCDGFYKHLVRFDNYNTGLVEKDKFMDILEKMFSNLD